MEPLSTSPAHDERDAYVSRRALLAEAEGADPATLAVRIESRFMDWWFLLDPSELNRVLDRVPAADLVSRPLLATVFVSTGGSSTDRERDAQLRAHIEGLLEQSVSEARRLVPEARFALGLSFRLQGQLRAAHDLISTIEVAKRATFVTDPSGGWASLVEGQAAITAMLAGELVDAQRILWRTLLLEQPRHRKFHLRATYGALAILEAQFGERAAALELLSLADSVPRTESWVERGIDARHDVLRRYLSGPDSFTAIDAASRDGLGEFWPYATLMFGMHAVVTGRWTELHRHLRRLEHLVPPAATSDGMPGTVVPWLRCLSALHAGDTRAALRAIAEADPQVVLTSAAGALIALRQGRGQDALEHARAVTSGAADLAWLVALGRYLTAEALCLVARDTEACDLLESMPDSISDDVLAAAAGSIASLLGGSRLLTSWGAPDNAAVRALRSAVDGAARRATAPALTPRQREMLLLLRAGHSRSEIAQRLHLSPNTVKSTLRALFTRLGVTNREQAIAVAVEQGILA